MRVGLGDPRWTPQEVLLPQLADETPAERRTRAEIMGDNIRVGHPWAGIRFDAGLLKRPMATADAMIEALMRHYGDLRLAALPEQRGEIEQLRREIARVLVKGEGGIEHLAKATGTSVRTLQRRLKTPICLDESIKSVAVARDAIAAGACRIINIKPGRVGGYLEASRIHDLCASHGIPVWHGGMLESGMEGGANETYARLDELLARLASR